MANLLPMIGGALGAGALGSASGIFGELLKTPLERMMRGGASMLGFEDQLTPPEQMQPAPPAPPPGVNTGDSQATASPGYDWGALSAALGNMASTLSDASQKNYSTLAGLGAGASAFGKGVASYQDNQVSRELRNAQVAEARAKAGQDPRLARLGNSVDAAAIANRLAQLKAAGVPDDQAFNQAFNEVAGGKVQTYTDAGGNVVSMRRDPLPLTPGAPTVANSLPAQPQDGVPGGLLPPPELAPAGRDNPALPASALPALAPRAQVAGQETAARNAADRVKDLQTQNANIQSTLANLTQALELSPEAMQQGAVLSIDQQKELSRRFATGDNQRSLAAQTGMESNIMQSIGPMLTVLAGPGGVRAEEVEQLRDKMGNAKTVAERTAIMAPYADRLKNKLSFNEWQSELLSRNQQPTEDMKRQWFEEHGVQPDSFLPAGRKATDYLPKATQPATPQSGGWTPQKEQRLQELRRKLGR